MANDRTIQTVNHENHGARLAKSSELRHFFVMHPWSFIIARFALVLAVALMLGCGRRITKANVDEVTEGMSKKQVESILGPPSDIDNKDFLIMKKTTYVYHQGKETVTIVFKDDKVTEKQSTLSD